MADFDDLTLEARALHKAQVRADVRRESRTLLAEERRAKYEHMFRIVVTAALISLGLLGALKFDGLEANTYMISSLGIVVTLASLVVVRITRKDIVRIEFDGADAEGYLGDKYFEDNSLIKLFKRPESRKLPILTVPAFVHVVIILIWCSIMYSSGSAEALPV